MLKKEEIKAYLARIGINDIQPPTQSYLFELHRAHVKNIPWETVDIFAGRPVSIDVRESVQLMINRRSGYCFHLNGAFSALLRSLGYQVSWHRGGVQPVGEEPRIDSFHLGLTVSMDNEQENESWIVDVGLGDMPYEPLPLHAGAYEQGPFTYKVKESGVVKNGWRLEQDLPAPFIGVDFAPEAVLNMKEFEQKHDHYSRSAESPWMNLFLIQHRHASGSNELRGCIWSKREKTGVEKVEIRNKSQWFEVLGDIFGEHLVNYSSQERDDLWKKVLRNHEEWKKSTTRWYD
ncbi:arylamine N-acetyltransferase family protein [Paenibacillus rhizophilus]|uniref:Arylamine N-acetyltransferase n=1 Tax=Paenibacillus rhizophilus TaxID=1850366 RepID=A0A3N9P8I5_9BACL|nr:arylamine N-acetyltransferase [Paenibacillus rhizophilus]RQW12538.1 arylamine N-acetyltransferase [Paenibacillus rhizophilus]